jgi:hypothetical protein
MSRIKDPGEKKRLAYEQEYRNAYGEPPKAWRKQKPLKKAKARRAFRKATNDLLQATLGEADAPQNVLRKAGSIRKEEILDHGKVKLGSYVKARIETRKSMVGARKRRQAKSKGEA